jgi:hypothetical protein
MPVGPRRPAALVAIGAAAAASLLLAACGSSSKRSPSAESTTSTSTAASSARLSAVSDLPAAENPSASQFPSARGQSLRQLARRASSSVQLGSATGTFVPGSGRFAFALNTSSGAFVYAPTAIYVAPNPNSAATGPIATPADPMGVAPQYRSKQNTGPGGIQAIYHATVPLPHAGTYDVLALTRGPRGMIGSTGEIAVARSSPIPNVGHRAPAIATDTPATFHGNVALVTTRVPPDDMHAVSFNQVLGKRPVLLLFSTPQLCTSRVCGPVTDVVVSLERQYGGRMAFIHQEVYANNQPNHGLRPQMKAFHVQTEPWLFTINRHGIIAARLEGAYGVNEVRQAIQAALR